MNYLIDGHNLIGRMPDIDLADPDDEAKLVLRLVNWAAVGKNRRIIVVFDGGVPGQQWFNFHSDRVKVVFVPQGRSADSWLIRFLRQEVRNPQEFTLVTSDQAILKAAEARRVAGVRSAEFAAQMTEELTALLQQPHPGNAAAEPPADKPVRDDEVAAWLELFGGEPQLTIKPYRPRPSEPSPVPVQDGAQSAEPVVPTDPDDVLLSPDEVAAWLALFGGEPRPSRPPSTTGPTTGRRRSRPTAAPKTDEKSPLSQDDIDLWHQLYGDG